MTFLCSEMECFAKHCTQNMGKAHMPFSAQIIVKVANDRESIIRFKEKVSDTARLLEGLQWNLEQLNAFEEEFKRAVEEIQIHLETVRIETEQKIGEIRFDLENKLEDMKRALYEDNWATPIVDGYNANKDANLIECLKTIETSVNLNDVIYAISNITTLKTGEINHQIHLPPAIAEIPPQATLKIYGLVNKDIVEYDTSSNSTRSIPIPNFYCNPDSSGVYLPDMTLLICGGFPHTKEAYMLNPNSESVQRLPDMLEARSAHLIAHLNFKTYVFGGVGDKSAEVFSDSMWEPLPSVNYKRWSGNAAVWEGRIYLSGNGSKKVEVFDPATSTYSTLDMVLPFDKRYVVSAVVGDELLFLQRNKAIAYDLRRGIIRGRSGVKQKHWWSRMAPVVSGEEIIFFNGAKGQMIHFNTSTLTIT